MAVQAAERERAQAARLPEGDVIRTLLEQHARIRDLFVDVRSTHGEHRRQAFAELRALLAVHETAEELVLRPVSRRVVGEEVANARDKEEAEATRDLRELEKMDVFAAEFDARLATFEEMVGRHALREETSEFPAVSAECDAEQRHAMGDALRTVERFAPTHPHPSTAGSPVRQWMVGPFASVVDRVKDTLEKGGRAAARGATGPPI